MNEVKKLNRLKIAFLSGFLILVLNSCLEKSITYQDVNSLETLDGYNKLKFESEIIKTNIIDRIKRIEIYSSLPFKHDLITFKLLSKSDTIIGLNTYLDGNKIDFNQSEKSKPFITIELNENKEDGFNLIYQHIYQSKILSELVLNDFELVSHKVNPVKNDISFMRMSRNGNFKDFGDFKLSSNGKRDTSFLLNGMSLFKAFYVDSVQTTNAMEQ